MIIPRRATSILLLILLGLTAVVTGCRTSRAEPGTPFRFRVLTFNIHHGEGVDGRIDLDRIARLIREHRADLVALQEVDRGTARTQRRDFPAELGAATGLTPVFFNNYSFQGGEYGNAILSRYPVIQATNYLLPRISASEQRGLLQTTIELPKGALTFLATHLDHRPVEEDRLASVERITQLVESLPQSPLIIAGDFNAGPDSETCRRLRRRFEDAWARAGTGDGFTIPSVLPLRRIDYIWYTPHGALMPVRAVVIPTDASDHLPLLVEFEIPYLLSRPAVRRLGCSEPAAAITLGRETSPEHSRIGPLYPMEGCISLSPQSSLSRRSLAKADGGERETGRGGPPEESTKCFDEALRRSEKPIPTSSQHFIATLSRSSLSSARVDLPAWVVFKG